MATGSSLAVTGNLDGLNPVIVDTMTTVNVGTTYQHSDHFNKNATTNAAILYNLPSVSVGRKHCFFNSYNGMAANDGTLEVKAGLGQYVICPTCMHPPISGSGGWVISSGLPGDGICVEGIDTLRWQVTEILSGAWTLN